MKVIPKTVVIVALLATLFTATTLISQTSEFPAKPMTYIIPFTAGGESDISAQYQQDVWESVTGLPIVIQYQPGAGGAKAWSQLNSIPGDGYTLMGINLPHTVLQPLSGNVGYKTKDLTPLYYFHYTPNAIFVRQESPFETLKELLDYAKKNPATVTFAGSGSHSANHLGAATLNELAGVKTTYIPFTGTGAAITAIIGGQTTAGFNYAPTGLKVGNKMRMLAVASEKRMPAFPDVPTFKELGFELVSGAYRGISVPKSTPEAVKKKISEIIAKVNKHPSFIKKMEANGFVLTDVSYDKMDEFVAKKTKEYTTGAKILGIIN